MAHFFGEVWGSGGAGSRTGTKKTGIQAHIRGWHVGVHVCIRHIDGKDVVRVYRTGGSGASGLRELVAEIEEGIDG